MRWRSTCTVSRSSAISQMLSVWSSAVSSVQMSSVQKAENNWAYVVKVEMCLHCVLLNTNSENTNHLDDSSIIIGVIYQEKRLNIHCVQLLRCDDLLVFSVFISLKIEFLWVSHCWLENNKQFEDFSLPIHQPILVYRRYISIWVIIPSQVYF